MKTCTKCKETKALSEFHKNKSKKDGLRSSCKQCKRKYYSEYYAANRDKVRDSVRKYRAANPDKVRDKEREYYAVNPDKKRESVREWKAANPERVKSYEHARRARKVGLYGNEPDHARIAEWMELTKDDACRWCGTRDFSEGVHWDHVVPLSIGGPHEWWNVVKTCASCNLKKNAKLPEAVGFI